MREGFAYSAFTERGQALAQKLCASLGGQVRGEGGVSLADWTAEQFPLRAGLVFIGAAGIAVRAIAPHVLSKAADPAVVCVDERGEYVIPLLSGHLGGANELARQIAALTGGVAVITTATDINGLFAVDLWAKRQNLLLLQPERIRTVSAKILRGETVAVDCPWPISGERPEGVTLTAPGDVAVDYRRRTDAALQLVPRVLSLGIGCRRGTTAEQLETAFEAFCFERGILPQAIRNAASITVKADEQGLLDFCRNRNLPVSFYSAARLQSAPGTYTASAFVESRVGVDNVCERASVRVSGGVLVEEKFARDGVTFALALRAPMLDWRWRHG